FDGSQTSIVPANCGKPGTPQVDTVAITGTEARRNKIEKSVILGPTCGDAVSVDNGAGQGAGAGSAENVVLDSELTRAADRGVKINNGVAAIARSCVHDNQGGGILSTLGGTAKIRENVVQYNTPGMKNGVTVLGTGTQTSTLCSDGNIIRFNGARG